MYKHYYHTPFYSSVYSRKMQVDNMTDKKEKISDQLLLHNLSQHQFYSEN